MDLTIVIVNYNVKYYLHQLLLSIFRSTTTYSYEIIVVDNASQDGSVDFLQSQAYASQITLIANDDNVGFSAANNQGIKRARGKFTLLLNPDTLVRADTLQAALSYITANPTVGALGVKMVNGAGVYLPESKRGFPTLWTSFCKISGLLSLLPRSRTLNQYYRGDLRNDEIQDVEVLTGAFFLSPTKLLKEIGLLDETFFMYGEDIDLSHRVSQAGYDVVYYPRTSIIHYKGESTDKDSVKYIKNFYGAMKIFADKHFSLSTASLLSILLGVTIAARIFFQYVRRILDRLWNPISDFVLFFIAQWGIALAWATYYHQDANYYAQAPLLQVIGLTSSVWVVVHFLFGSYDRPANFRRWTRGALTAWISLIIIYAGLSEWQRVSRALVILGVPMSGLILGIKHHWIWRRQNANRKTRKLAVVANDEEWQRIMPLLQSFAGGSTLVGQITVNPSSYATTLGSLDVAEQIVRYHEVTDLLFCLKDVSSAQVINCMSAIGSELNYQMISPDTLNILGTSQLKSSEGLNSVTVSYAIDQPHLRRNKRLLDFILSLVLLLVSPLLIITGSRWNGLLSNIYAVMIGRKTWVGYGSEELGYSLPSLKDSVLTASAGPLYYARDYNPWFDIQCILAHWKKLDR